MQLKSPGDTPIHVALLNGHAITIGQEARDVPQMFLQEAFAKGAIPAEMNADSFVAEEKNDTDPTTAELLVAGVKKMLVENADDFTGAGLPNRKTLSAIVGWNVSAEELGVAWAQVQAEA
jgi:hypothetical protein